MAVDWNSPAIIDKVRRGALKGVVKGLGIVEARAVYLITQTAKTGRNYKRRGGKVHRASAPGEPFANDSGDTLRRRDISIDATNLSGTLHFHSINAVRLEFGTRRMLPRPFARRALSETATQVQDAIMIAIVEELRK